jgi:hypothetical protein
MTTKRERRTTDWRSRRMTRGGVWSGGVTREEGNGRLKAAIGMESEFTVHIDNEQVRPEDAFGSPRGFIRGPLMHRTGRSYHLPTGGAVYFDTGVIEVATPMIEIEPGCAARAGRSLWESIRFMRYELDDWEKREKREVRLSGFSTHYNVSFDRPAAAGDDSLTVHKLALLLTHILPFPVMLLAANRRSTGIGVRPRRNRIEVTADFTPDPALMIATATAIVGIVREVMTWPSYELSELADRGIPVVRGFRPERHRSRKGWVARYSSFPRNPFTCDVNAAEWDTGDADHRSMRDISASIVGAFRRSIDRYGNPRSLRLIDEVVHGSGRSLLELADRPEAYERVGVLCRWDDLFSDRVLSRSAYERVIQRAVSREPIALAPDQYRPTHVRGWTHVVLRRVRDGARRILSLDELADRLDDR